MTCNNHNARRNNPVVSLLRAIPLYLSVLFAAPAAFALDSGDIFVVSARGEVRVTMKGAAVDVRAGSVLELPATLRTGRDGGVELKQGATTVSVGPDTTLDFPALESPGAPIDRILQPRGNAFYNIGKRDGRKLRVETPYLVGVVKGTQFNVSSRDEATTISLFEGALEVRATDDSAVVDLKAGEIASRRRGDKSINVIRMDSGKLPTTAPRPAGSGGSLPEAPRGGVQDGSLVDNHEGNGFGTGSGNGVGLITTVDPGRAANTVAIDVRTPAAVADADAGVSLAGNSAAVNVAANAAMGDLVDTTVSANLGVGDSGAAVDLSTSTAVDAGPASAAVDTGVSVDVGASDAALDLSTSAVVDAGPASIAVDTGAAVDLGASGVAVDLSTSTAVDAGPASVAVDTGVSVDVGAGDIGADLTTGTVVDAGPVTADLGTGAAVDIGTGGTATVDTSASLGVVETPVDVSAGVTAGVDLSSGTVDLGVTVGGLDVGLGLDAGLGANEPATDTGSSTTPATDTGNTGTVDVGGLLDGLLRRPGRR